MFLEFYWNERVLSYKGAREEIDLESWISCTCATNEWVSSEDHNVIMFESSAILCDLNICIFWLRYGQMIISSHHGVVLDGGVLGPLIHGLFNDK